MKNLIRLTFIAVVVLLSSTPAYAECRYYVHDIGFGLVSANRFATGSTPAGSNFRGDNDVGLQVSGEHCVLSAEKARMNADFFITWEFATTALGQRLERDDEDDTLTNFNSVNVGAGLGFRFKW